MGRKFIKKFGVVLFLIPISIGIYLIYQVVSPEIEYQKHSKQNEQLFIAKAESKDTTIENRLMIPSIGVDLKIDTQYEALDYGGWVQELNEDDIPNLIGVHRFGLNTLSAEEKLKTTLYHVNKLNEGDEVIVWWRGEEHVYEVENIYESNQKPEIHGDELYLYTCLLWGEDERVFVTTIEN